METLITIQCINQGVWKNHLTEGKIYSALIYDAVTYRVIDNSGEYNYYFKNKFKELKQTI
tara:strand:+ start:121 stop:300 length:180 start_codon:yes stop_codon:yes gene_type:complete